MKQIEMTPLKWAGAAISSLALIGALYGFNSLIKSKIEEPTKKIAPAQKQIPQLKKVEEPTQESQ